MKRVPVPRPESTGATLAYELDERDRYKLAAMAGNGQSQKCAARLIGCAPDALRRIFERDALALAAWETGRATFEQEIVTELFRIARDREHPKQVLALTILANNLLGWSRGDAQDGEQSRVRITLDLPAALDAQSYAAVVARGRELGPEALEAEAERA